MRTIMKTYLEVIAENISIPKDSNVVVQFWGENNDKDALLSFTEALKQNHASVSGILFDKNEMITKCEAGPYSIFDQITEETLVRANVVIDLCTYSPTSLVALTHEKSRSNFIQFMRQHFNVISGPEKMLIQIRIPSIENATESGLPLETYSKVYENMIRVDYNEMRERCKKLIHEYEAHKKVTIKTGEAHVLTLDITNRKWFQDSGEGDFPAGEIYIAPLENSANGSYKADYLYWEGEHFKDVVLTFENGTLIDSKPLNILEELKQADANAIIIAEFGLGINPQNFELTGYSLFDEKMADSCHIAVGMNHLFGGENKSVVHVDFVSAKPQIAFS